MQFDKTQIAVRERSMLDIMDLSLHVLTKYFSPLAITFSFGMIPFMLLNHVLAAWMASEDYMPHEELFPYRYMWNMMLLVYIEAPLASIFATRFLGQTVFHEQPSLREVFRDVAGLAGRIIWCHLFVRAILTFLALYWFIERKGDTNYVVELLLFPAVALWSLLVRASRPFINEIIVLERNPLFVSNLEKQAGAQSIRLRSSRLHTPAAGDSFVRCAAATCIGLMTWMGVYGVLIFFKGVLTNSWTQTPVMLTFGYPLALWIVAFFFTVVRFLCYLDLRIRQEGWEVELKLRAEAAKITGRVA